MCYYSTRRPRLVNKNMYKNKQRTYSCQNTNTFNAWQNLADFIWCRYGDTWPDMVTLYQNMNDMGWLTNTILYIDLYGFIKNFFVKNTDFNPKLQYDHINIKCRQGNEAHGQCFLWQGFVDMCHKWDSSCHDSAIFGVHYVISVTLHWLLKHTLGI